MLLYDLVNQLDPKVASPNDIDQTVGDKLDSIYMLIMAFMLIWLAFKLHGLFRSMFNNLGGGKNGKF